MCMIERPPPAWANLLLLFPQALWARLLLAAYLSARKTMINGSALCAAPAVT